MSKSPRIAQSWESRVEALKEKRRDGGFTLIELLVVVVIIGILVAIAIPLYLQYQNGAKNKSAESDLRGGISTIETFYGNHNNVYPDSVTTGTGDVTLATTLNNTADTSTIKVTAGNTLYVVKNGTTYLACSWNKDGKHWFSYNSANGGSVTDNGTIDTLPTTCLPAA